MTFTQEKLVKKVQCSPHLYMGSTYTFSNPRLQWSHLSCLIIQQTDLLKGAYFALSTKILISRFLPKLIICSTYKSSILKLVWPFRLNFLGHETDSAPVGPWEALSNHPSSDLSSKLLQTKHENLPKALWVRKVPAMSWGHCGGGGKPRMTGSKRPQCNNDNM